jgi:phosphoribosylformylglycinamidine synthase PurS subunit
MYGSSDMATEGIVKARIIVTPRKEVLDPQGEAVRGGLHSMGYDEVGSVRVGRYVELELTGNTVDAEARVHAMCEQLLANEVIEDFSFTLEG